ncbi:alpha/beta hydrolase [Noviherbaspirillum sp. L7-7A]|uniref:alpha/beta hydrolase n=1 Tax=Noviherbaspirillum sp. L7-7A TaxID=2850560 RepID=UPI001C2C6263|nr:alpha/beta hydrolase [Noviherbaspirillum sp. L7-7A]MBV0882276.1 alpha/beta hydrolase [Noviherbaspirillum sp. L7-7A]
MNPVDVNDRQAALAGDGEHELESRELEVAGFEGSLAGRLYRAVVDGRRDLLIVFFHGGGFVDGDLDEADGFLRRLAVASGYPVVLSSTYTLAPNKPFPAAVEDAHAVLAWAGKNKSKLGWTGKRMLVAGIEAGGNIAAVAAMMSRDRGAPRLAGQILIMPMLDPGLSTCSMREMPSCPDKAKVVDECVAAYRGYLPHAADRSHPYASPLQSSRLKNLPPALILSTDDDPLRDEAEAYGAKLIAAGVRTTVRRLPPAQLEEPNARNECACTGHVLYEIANFIAGLEGPPASSGR